MLCYFLLYNLCESVIHTHIFNCVEYLVPNSRFSLVTYFIHSSYFKFLTIIKQELSSVMSNSLRPLGWYSPWNTPGQNTGVGTVPFSRGSSQPRDLSPFQFSRSVMSNSLWPHGLQHARLPCPSPTPRAYSNSCPLVGDAIQSSHPLSSPSPPAFNLSQHQGVF